MEKPLLSFSLWTPELLDPLGFFKQETEVHI